MARRSPEGTPILTVPRQPASISIVQAKGSFNLTTVQVFGPEEVVAYASRFFTLKPGDLILTGTPPGVGAFRKPPLWLKDGDEVVCEIDGIGRIANRVTASPPRAAL